MRLFLAALGLVALGLAVPAQAKAKSPTILTLSNRADLVSGGDVLVQVDVAAGAFLRSLSAGERDVTGMLQHGRGLLTGLPVGTTTLRAVDSRGVTSTLVVTNHPIGGPVFAGPQVQPWTCATTDHGLAASRDRQCDTPSAVSWQYLNAVTQHFADYDPAAPPAAALIATTTTDEGRSVPFVVRVEKGVMDRGLYTVAVLKDAWNHELATPFGGSCNPRHQQEPVDTGPNEAAPTLFSVLDPAKLGAGFMVAHNNLGNLGSNCNDVVAAESLMMLKEHITEQYGLIRRTIGYGCSGGSMLQHLIAANYPGLLDGIIPACSFPDFWSTATESEDCHLLKGVFDADPTWTPGQQALVSGYQTMASCAAFDDLPINNAQSWFDPAQQSNCGDGFTGLRCSVADYDVALLGHDGSGVAHRPFDNVGVQYGLRALRSAAISAEQFVSLNERIGADDLDWKHVTARVQADPAGVRNAYAGGRITDGHLLADVPILDLRGTSNQEIHTDFHSYELRARLDEANGSHANQVIWTSHPLTIDPLSYARSFAVMDQWLDAIDRDHRPLRRAIKVALDRPAVAVDSCWEAGRQVTDPTLCAAAFPHYGDTRYAAGGRVSGGVISCGLRRLRRADYSLSDGQWARLLAVFPHGVCDPAKNGQGQVRAIPWATYASGAPGALGAVPVSHAQPAVTAGVPRDSLAATGSSVALALAGGVLLLVAGFARRVVRR